MNILRRVAPYNKDHPAQVSMVPKLKNTALAQSSTAQINTEALRSQTQCLKSQKSAVHCKQQWDLIAMVDGFPGVNYNQFEYEAVIY